MPTLSQAQDSLSARLGLLVAAASLPVDPGLPAGAYQEAIAYGLSACGIFAADPTNPTDLEVQGLPIPVSPGMNPWYFFLDVAELRLLDAVAMAYAVKPEIIQLPDVTRKRAIQALLNYVAVKRKNVMTQWGFGSPVIGMGVATPRRSGVEGHIFNI